MLVTTGIFNINSLQMQNFDFIARAAITQVNNSANYYEGANKKTMRVDVTMPLQDYDHVIKMINTVIPEGQTYLDLTGQTMLYVLSGREKPVYLNQSVTNTSGEYSQKRLIEEIEKEYDGICDFALVNTNLWTMNIDGISGCYKYYYVMEYLYNSFTPLCKTFDNYTLWVRSTRYDEFTLDNDLEKSETVSFDSPIMHSNLTDSNWTNGILNVNHHKILFPLAQAKDLGFAKQLYSSTGSANVINIIANSEWIQIEIDQDASMFVDGVTGAEISTRKYTSIDYNYLGMTHSVSIGQIPYLWGQYDNKKSWKNKVVDNSLDITGPMSNKVQADAKYAMISINSSIDGNAVLSFQNDSGENVSVFNFSLVKGNNRYMIRCSTDWWWNRDAIKSYRVEYDVQAKYEGISFLVGD